MAVNEDAEQEFAPQKKKPPSEDEKRFIYLFIYFQLLWHFWFILVVVGGD